VLADVQQGTIRRRRRRLRLRALWWPAATATIVVAAVAVATLLLLLLPTADRTTGVPPPVHELVVRTDGTGAASAGAPSTLAELIAADPSPTSSAQQELDMLSGMLDSLETTPYPEFGFPGVEP
jgi:hypothetical protein